MLQHETFRVNMMPISQHFCPHTSPCVVVSQVETVCDANHHDLGDYTETDTTSYFKEVYYESNKYWPSKCCGKDCGKVFGSKEYRVGPGSNPVHMCRNAVKKTHACTHALCKQCYSQMKKESPTKRTKKRKTRFGDD